MKRFLGTVKDKYFAYWADIRKVRLVQNVELHSKVIDILILCPTLVQILWCESTHAA